MARSILVPLDGSTFGEHALPLAAGLARRTGATLYLVHVHQIMPPESIAGVAIMDSVDLHMRQDERAYLADAARRLRDAGPVSVETALMDGQVVPALREYAQQRLIDLVVMSTHGRGALGRFWLGSVADELMSELPRPTILVHPHEGKPDLRRQPELKTILVPLDGTPTAEQALEPALALGKVFDTRLTVVRVIQPAVRPSYLPDGGTVLGLTHSTLEEVKALQTRALEESRKYLNGVAADLAERGFAVNTRVLIDETPAAAILAEAEVGRADLIAVQTHGRHGLSRVLHRSVADKLVRGGVVPVLVGRAPAQM